MNVELRTHASFRDEFLEHIATSLPEDAPGLRPGGAYFEIACRMADQFCILQTMVLQDAVEAGFLVEEEGNFS